MEKTNHPDVEYIKRDDIGKVIAKGLSVLYKTQPNNPCDYLARWLLNHAEVQRQKTEADSKEAQVKELKERQQEEREALKKEEEKQAKAQEQEEARHKAFDDKVAKSDDLSDQLQDLAGYLQDNTKATGVYIGQLIRPKKEIEEDADETAHVDEEAEEIVRYIHATDKHEYIVDQTLGKEQGLTHDVFKPPEEGDEEEEKPEEEMTEEEKAAKAEKERLKALPKTVFVKEVVREPRMHFFDVPKLGSYLAVELKYASCLSEDSYDEAYKQFLAAREKRKEQQMEREEFEKEQEELKKQKEEDGEEFKPEEKEWEEITEPAFETKERRFVICLDTMGQDREFSAAEKEFAVSTVQKYCGSWFKLETENLTRDIKQRDLMH